MRKKFHWVATLQDDQGKVIEYPLAVYWRPDLEDSASIVAITAASEAYWKSKKQRTYAPVSATRVEESETA